MIGISFTQPVKTYKTVCNDSKRSVRVSSESPVKTYKTASTAARQEMLKKRRLLLLKNCLDGSVPVVYIP